MSPLSLALLAACAAPKTAPEPAASATTEPAAAPASTAPLQRRAFAPTLDGQALLAGISYGAHREGQRPGGPDPSPEQIREDLGIIAEHWGMLRMYGSRGPVEDVLRLIAEEGLPLKVMVGAWIDADDAAANQAEVDAAIDLARRYPDQVFAVSIGNETQVSWSAHRSPVQPLIDHIRAVRAAVTQPVTTADDYSYWVLPESQPLAAELDFLLVHVHPLWNGKQLEESVAWTATTLDRVRATHPDMPLVIGEIGWATSHDPSREEGKHIKAPTGEAEQATFYADWTAWAAAQALPAFWFQAFDEPWKGGDSPPEVEKNWGLFNVDRSPKRAMGGGEP